jgi:hypothetical protein
LHELITQPLLPNKAITRVKGQTCKKLLPIKLLGSFSLIQRGRDIIMFITEKTGMLRTSHTAHVLHTIRSNTTPSEFGTQGVKGQRTTRGPSKNRRNSSCSTIATFESYILLFLKNNNKNLKTLYNASYC